MKSMITVLMVIGFAVPSFAQTNGKFEQITVAATAIGITGSTLTGMSGCAILTETAEIRMRFDGTNPTASVGTPVPAGGAYVFTNINDLTNLKMIRTGGTSATAWVSCWPEPGNAVPVGAGAGGGGSATSTIGEQQTQTALLTDIETDIDDIETSLAIIDNVVFGAGTAAAALRVTFASDAAPITIAAADADIGNVDLELAGTAVSATNPVAIRLSDGSAFVTAATDATHDSAASATGPQITLGATTTYQTAVTTGDATRAAAGLDGIQITRPFAHVGDYVKGYLANTDGASTAVVAAQGAGIRFCATTLIVSNSSATNVTVDLRDGAAGSVIATVPASANMGGAAIPLDVPLCTTANTALAMDGSAAASTVAVTAIGFRTAQ